ESAGMGQAVDRRLVISRRALGTGVAASMAAAALPGMGSASSSGTFDGLGEALDGMVASGSVPGLVALVAKGDSVHVHAAGVQDIATKAPMQRDTIFAVASIGKPITATAAMILVEEGVLGLDDPVDRW